jgi:glycyl-tRNA synthetase (class II)
VIGVCTRVERIVYVIPHAHFFSFQVYETPRMVERVRVKANKGKIGKKYRGDAKVILEHLMGELAAND